MSFTTKQVVDMIIEEDWDLGAEVICERSDDDFDWDDKDDDCLPQGEENDTNNSDEEINERYEI